MPNLLENNAKCVSRGRSVVTRGECHCQLDIGGTPLIMVRFIQFKDWYPLYQKTRENELLANFSSGKIREFVGPMKLKCFTPWPAWGFSFTCLLLQILRLGLWIYVLEMPESVIRGIGPLFDNFIEGKKYLGFVHHIFHCLWLHLML